MQPPAPRTGRPAPCDYVKTTLPNGLRVIKVPMRHLRSALAVMHIKSGPRFETPGRNGIPHFVEHMLFKGTPSHPGPVELSKAVSRIGADLNGSTMAEYSELTLSAHAQWFREGLALLADMLLRPSFDEYQIERERPVILSEMARERNDQGEVIDIDELSYSLMWPEAAGSFSCLGSPETIRRITRGDLLLHYQAFYAPANMVLCIAGNYGDDADLDACLAELFGSFQRTAAPAVPPAPDPQRRPLSLFKNTHTQTASLKLCHRACSYRDPDFRATLVLNDILGGGVSSRLFTVLREDLGLVYDVSSAATLFSDAGSIDIYTSAEPDAVAQTVEAAIAVTQDLAGGIDPDELEMYKQRVACQLDMLRDNPGDMAEWYGVRELLLEPERIETPGEEAGRLREVTADELTRVAQGIFRPDRRSLVALGPCNSRVQRRVRRLLES